MYGFTLTKKALKQEKCPHCGEVIREYEEDEFVGSCWGFFGDSLEDNGILGNISSDLKIIE